jgi:hypothetical protein
LRGGDGDAGLVDDLLLAVDMAAERAHRRVQVAGTGFGFACRIVAQGIEALRSAQVVETTHDQANVLVENRRIEMGVEGLARYSAICLAMTRDRPVSLAL